MEFRVWLLLFIYLFTQSVQSADSTVVIPQSLTTNKMVTVSVLHYLRDGSASSTGSLCPAKSTEIKHGIFLKNNTAGDNDSAYIYYVCNENFWSNDPFYLALLNASPSSNYWISCIPIFSGDPKNPNGDTPGACTIKYSTPPLIRFVLRVYDLKGVNDDSSSYGNTGITARDANFFIGGDTYVVKRASHLAGSGTTAGYATDGAIVTYAADSVSNPNPNVNMTLKITIEGDTNASYGRGASSGADMFASHFGNYACWNLTGGSIIDSDKYRTFTFTPSMWGQTCEVFCSSHDWNRRQGWFAPPGADYWATDVNGVTMACQ